MSNLRLINETEVTTGISEFYVNNIFTDDFDIYKVVFNNISTASSSSCNLFHRFVDSSGIAVTSSKYTFQTLQIRDDGVSAQYRGDANTSVSRVLSDLSPEGHSSTNWIYNPTNTNSYTYYTGQSMSGISSVLRMGQQICVLEETSKITGFGFFVNGATTTFSTGVMRTYGLRVDA